MAECAVARAWGTAWGIARAGTAIPLLVASSRRHDHRALQGVRSQGRRAALVRVLARARRLRGERRAGRRAARLFPAHPAAERHRIAPHGARAHLDDRGRAGPLPPHARLQHALAAGHRSRRHRHPDGRRAPAQARGQEPPRPRARGVRRAGLGVEGPERRAHRAAAAGAGHQRRLAPQQVHDGSGPHPRGARGLRPALPGGADLPRHPPHPLGLRGADRPLQPRGRERAGQRRALRVRLRGGGRRRGDRGRHHPPRDHARRHRGGRPPRRPALRAPARQIRPPPLRRSPHPHRHRRRPRRPQVRHRRGEGDARARLQRLRHRQAPQAGGDHHPRPRRHHERGRRALRRARPLRGAQGGEEGAGGEGAGAREQAAPARAAAQRAQRLHRRADDLHAVVRPHGPAGGARARRRARGQDPDHPRGVGQDLRALDDQHPRLVHLAPALVGPPHPRLALRRLRPHHRGQRRARRRVRGLRSRRGAPGRGRPRHLVLQRALAVLHAGLARADPRPASGSTPRAIWRRATTSSSSGSRG